MELDETTLQLILEKIEAVERNVSEKIDNLGKLFDQKIDAVKEENSKIVDTLEKHEARLNGHDKDIARLENVEANRAKEIVNNVLKITGGALLAYVVVKAFPAIKEFI